MSNIRSAAALRIIDANANRAREALRVLEDHARFALNSQPLSADLKAIRHDLATALSPLLADAILHRDTVADVGTTNKLPTEFARESTRDVITAAGKRLGEALRALEEFAKTTNPQAAADLEKLRYRFYVIEQTLALTLRPANRFADVELYVLISEQHCLNRPWQDVARAAIAGGAQCLQLREKDLDAGPLLQRAREFVRICRDAGVISIVNDRLDVAIAAGADGVHLGQSDLPPLDARRLAGHDFIIGVSTHELAHARKALLDGADYIGVGPIYRSKTKTRSFVAGLPYAREVAAEIRLPAVAIAGINRDNLDEVLATGLRAIAVTAAVTEQPDVAAAARALRERLQQAPATPAPGTAP